MIVLDPLLRVAMIAIDLYIWALIISVILTWLIHFNVVNTRNQFVKMIAEFLWRVTEPALRQIRRFVPSFGGIDISPVVLILLLIFLQMVIANVHRELLRGY